MGLKLVRNLLAGILIFVGMSDAAIARGNGQATVNSLPSGKCGEILQSVQDILTKSEQGDTGVVPESLSDMPTNVSIDEEPNNPEGIDYQLTHKVNNKKWGRCFKISGDWFSEKDNNQVIKKDGGNFPRIDAYVFFKDLAVKTVHENLTVGVVDEDKRFIALTAKAMNDGKETGAFAGAKYMNFSKINSVPNYISKNKQSIIWLNQTKIPNVVTAVLCEDSCSDILALFRVKRVANNKPSGTSNLNIKGVSKTAKSGEKQTNMDTDSNEARSEFKEVSKCAVDKFMDSETVFEFVNEHDNKPIKLDRKDLSAQECTPLNVGKTLTLNKLSTFFYNNCISISGYEILKAKPTIQSGETSMVTFKLKKTKPDKISKIEVLVKMADVSPVTDACFLRAKIVNTETDTEVFGEEFYSTKGEPMEHTFSLVIEDPITWKGKTLVLEKRKGADCKPEGGEYRIKLTSKIITNTGVLKPQTRLELHSMQGKALLVLNTMIGVESSNASDSSIKFYPFTDDQRSRDLFTGMIVQILQQLHEEVTGLTVGLRQQNGRLDIVDISDISDISIISTDFNDQLAKQLASIIVDNARFAKGNFVWDTMLNTVRNKVVNQSGYTYRIFIGQSGASTDESYCESPPRKLALDQQEVNTFIYDFAVKSNIDNPYRNELTDNQLQEFPAKVCDDATHHVVLFPQVMISGWDQTTSSLLTTAFKNVH
jgi:hypothetical protein